MEAEGPEGAVKTRTRRATPPSTDTIAAALVSLQTQREVVARLIEMDREAAELLKVKLDKALGA